MEFGDITITTGNTLTIHSGTYRINSSETIDVDSGGELIIEDGVHLLMEGGADIYVEGKITWDGVTIEPQSSGVWWGMMTLSGSGADDSSIENSIIMGSKFGVRITGVDAVIIEDTDITYTDLYTGLDFYDSQGSEVTDLKVNNNFGAGLATQLSNIDGLRGEFNDNGTHGIYSHEVNILEFGDVEVDAGIVATGNADYGLRAHDDALIDIGSLFLGDLHGGNSSVYDNDTKEAKITDGSQLDARNTYWNTIKAPGSAEIELSGGSSKDVTNWLMNAPSKAGPQLDRSAGGSPPAVVQIIKEVRELAKTDRAASIALVEAYINTVAGSRAAHSLTLLKAQVLSRSQNPSAARGVVTSALNSGRVGGFVLSDRERLSWAKYGFYLAVNRLHDPVLASRALDILHVLGDENADSGYYDRLVEHKERNGNFQSTPGVATSKVSDDGRLSVEVYPNPFNPRVSITVNIADDTKITAEIFNVLGQRVAMITDSDYQAGIHTFQFNASTLPSGPYFYRVRTLEGLSASGSITLLK